MKDLPEERIFPLINGGELIQTGERILFSRSRPGMIPLLTDADVEIDDVLDTLHALQEENKQLREAVNQIEDYTLTVHLLPQQAMNQIHGVITKIRLSQLEEQKKSLTPEA